MKRTLYLGSQSSSRQKLLQDASIPFIVVGHTSDENVIQGDMPFDQYVLAIAHDKMSKLTLPPDYRYALTADTLVHIVSSGRILGKPKDLEDAKSMLRAMRNEVVEVITGCCLQKKAQETVSVTLVSPTLVSPTRVSWTRVSWTTGALIEFNVPEDFLATYFEKEPHVLSAAGSCIVDSGYGQSFFKSINGSYSAVIGLPLFELRQELKKMGFVF